MTKSSATRAKKRGAATLEMTLVGIPLIFTLVSIFEISRGMWMYHTLTYAVKEGTRYAIVHGVNCVNNPPAVLNSCQVSVSQVAQVIENAGVGLDPGATTLTFCAPSVAAGGTCASPCTLSACQSGTNTTTTWPPTTNNAVGQTIEIDIKTPFNSALAMFWPGWAPVAFTKVNLGANSTDEIQF
jgi:Flp pilus assembly protein TadG